MTPMQLKTIREKELGLSQAKLAQLLGVDVGTISRWERGVRQIPALLRFALADLKGRTNGHDEDEKGGIRRANGNAVPKP